VVLLFLCNKKRLNYKYVTEFFKFMLSLACPCNGTHSFMMLNYMYVYLFTHWVRWFHSLHTNPPVAFCTQKKVSHSSLYFCVGPESKEPFRFLNVIVTFLLQRPTHDCKRWACLVLLQASLPVTTYYCTENKLAEMSSNLRQPEQIKKDYSQSKLVIRSAELTENSYPRTLTSSHPSDNVIKTSAEVTRQAVEITWCWSRPGNNDGTNRENPSTDNYLKVLEAFEISQ